MPVVFIHGVNTREGGAYDGIRDHLVSELKARVLAPLGWPDMKVATPYWGKHGVAFHWRPDLELEVIPKIKPFEHNAAARPCLTGVEAKVAQEELAGLSEAELTVVLSAIENVLRDPAKLDPALITQASEAEAANALNLAIQEQIQAIAGAAADSTKYERVHIPIVSAVVDRTFRIATVIASNRLRQRLQVNLSRFMGDAFVYARDRGTPEQPGAIIQTVLAALREAQAAAKADHEPLIVVTYSMGGNIFYDIATCFDKDAAACAAWIAVGSQTAHFEDMKLFCASVETVRSPNRVEKPSQVQAWFNLYDPLDPCAFAAEPVFKSVHDIRYATGVNAFVVHGAYFEQPALYLKICELLRSVIPRP